MNASESRLLDFVYGLHELQTVNELSERVCKGLTELVDGENVIICTHDGTNKVITSVVAKHMFSKANLMPEINQNGMMAQHPFWDQVFKEGMSAQVLSDLVSKGDWHRNPLYAEVFRPDGIEDQMNATLQGTPGNFVTLNVLKGRRGFRTEERERFLRLGKHISQAFFNARVSELTGVTANTHGAAIQIAVDLLGNPAGGPSSLSPSANFLFQSGGGFIDPVRDWLRGKVSRMNQGLLESNVRPLCLKAGGNVWLFTLRRDLFGAGYLLQGAVKTLSQDATCLSLREQEIMRLVCSGKTNQEIAGRLGLGTETVKTHLKHVFRKLSVPNRTAAVKAWHQTMSVSEEGGGSWTS